MTKEFDQKKMMQFGEQLVSEISTMFFANMVYIGEKSPFKYLPKPSISSSCLRRCATLHISAEFVADIRRALKPDSTFLLLESACSSRLEENLNPIGKLSYSVSTMFCLPFSLAFGGAGIGVCIGSELPEKLCRAAGFTHFQKLAFEHPLYALYEVKN